MIYLFNSAFRDLYRVNVLNTLFLPIGSCNQYRYRIDGNISPADHQDLKEVERGEPVIITFIDRFYQAAGGVGEYRFHPLRFGKLVSTEEVGGYLHFHVEFGDLVYPTDMAAFNNRLREALGTRGLPRITGGNPTETRDGYYAIPAGSIFLQKGGFLYGDEAWIAAVDALRQTRAYSDTPTERFVFARANLQESGTGKNLTPEIEGTSGVFKLYKGTKYELALSYRFPTQYQNQQATAALRLSVGDSLKLAAQSVVSINSHADQPKVPISVKKHVEDEHAGITFEWERTAQNDPAVIGATHSIEVAIRESPSVWFQLAAAVIAFTLLESVANVSVPTGVPNTIANIFAAAWPKLVLVGLAKAGTLLWMIKLFGQKVV
jgi:hypothetical protein